MQRSGRGVAAILIPIAVAVAGLLLLGLALFLLALVGIHPSVSFGGP